MKQVVVCFSIPDDTDYKPTQLIDMDCVMLEDLGIKVKVTDMPQPVDVPPTDMENKDFYDGWNTGYMEALKYIGLKI